MFSSPQHHNEVRLAPRRHCRDQWPPHARRRLRGRRSAEKLAAVVEDFRASPPSLAVVVLLLLGSSAARGSIGGADARGDGHRDSIRSGIRGDPPAGGQATPPTIRAALIGPSIGPSNRASKPAPAPATRLVLLRNNSLGAKCLDGSPPGYYFRRGKGAGRASWHVHLPVGAWCLDEPSCLRRSRSRLGSTTYWAANAAAAAGRRGKSYPSFTGLLSPSSGVNPAFHAWNLVWLVYCDGGGYTSTRGRVNVGGNRSVHMDGWNIVQAVMQDLRQKRGMAAPARILLSGSSAGGQAVVMLCDRVAAAFPAASTKCFADAAFLADARDRFGQYRWRDMVRQIASLHQINIPSCPKGASSEGPWMCFFPQYALPTVATPIFIYQSLFDLTLIEHGNQLGSNRVYSIKCLKDELFQQQPNVSYLVERKMWDQVAWKDRFCTPEERIALLTMASTVYSELRDIVTVGSSTVGAYIVNSLNHAVIASKDWGSLSVRGMRLRSVFTNWYLDWSKQSVFIDD
ncbi:hypothetical protein CLOM_g19509 [Closterium sp. NIES-68]|nr:hypothetical protein CLOM_g19509 [Closterium sp. NIES-68]GJP80790.1 hypothetical protein CLOP_g10991 [Closterium sp. NIES-67]